MVVSQRKGGVLLSYVSQTVNILSNLIYVPIMLRLLGQSEYGLYQLAAALISNLNILSLGFNSSYIRFYSRYKKDDDQDSIRKLNGMFMIIFTVIAIVCLVCGAVIITNARLVLGDKLTDTEVEKSKILMAFLVVSMALSFFNSVFQSQISAHNKFIWLKFVELLSYLATPIITLPLLILGLGSEAMVAVTTGVTFASCVINFFYAYKKLGVRFCFNNFDFSLFKEMANFTFYIFLNIIIEQINWSMDKLILGRVSGTNSVAIYAVGGQIVQLYRTVCGAIRSVFVPQINDMVVNRVDMQTLTKLFAKLGRVIYCVCFLIVSGFTVFGREFIRYWAGEGYDNSYIVALAMMIPLIVAIIEGPGIDIQRAMNKHKVRSIVYAFIAIANLLMSIYLAKRYGEVGAAIGTGISMIIGQGIFMNFYYWKNMHLKMGFFWREILRLIPASGVVLLVGFIISKFVYWDTLLSLGVCIAIYVVTYAAVFYVVGFNQYEKHLFSEPIKKILKRV